LILHGLHGLLVVLYLLGLVVRVGLLAGWLVILDWGGFAPVVRNDCEVWCMVTVGNAVCWSKRAAMGGRACNIGVRAFRLCESSHELAKAAPIAEDASPERAKAVYIANHAQERMQAEIDSIVEAGWASLQVQVSQ